METNLLKNISVDCVIFGFDMESLNVLLVERTMNASQSNDTLFSDLTLTGHHIYENEDLDGAAKRIVNDLTGLKNLVLEQFYSFGELDRLQHPNDQLWIDQFEGALDKRVVSIGYYSLLPSLNVNIKQKGRVVKWYPVNEISELAYDHTFILEKAISHLRYKLRYEPIGFEMLPPKFTLSQMQKLYEAVLGVELDKRNFRKKVSQMTYVVPLNEKQKGVSHKPAQLFMFSRDVYEKTKTERYDFFV
ncbi:MAG: DNA mismatch repair protein MutT [Salinivirgaceae bacterium]|jgi:8-oxo-dGTP diphosphatase|nr:DNA mismatch repair protein MutT [Salinivirgaceae bacterium]